MSAANSGSGCSWIHWNVEACRKTPGTTYTKYTLFYCTDRNNEFRKFLESAWIIPAKFPRSKCWSEPPCVTTNLPRPGTQGLYRVIKEKIEANNEVLIGCREIFSPALYSRININRYRICVRQGHGGQGKKKLREILIRGIINVEDVRGGGGSHLG